MNDNKIIELYDQGFSIKYISNVYFKYKNKNSKPIFINGVKCYPAKIYTKNHCFLYVNQIIYSYIINKDTLKPQLEEI